jgi:predicted nucleic acid-binding protein
VISFVLDNSVAMRWCFESVAHPYADSVLRRIASGDAAIVPVIWFYEASSVLSRAQNRGTLAAPKADEFIAELNSLNITADEESAARVFPDVHRVALAYRLTSYDASYLESALRRNLPLATLDNDMIRASKAAGVSVIAEAA